MRLENALEQFQIDRYSEYKEAYYTQTLTAKDDFDKIASEIEILGPNNLKNHEEIRENFETYFLKITQSLKKVLPSVSHNNPQ